MQKMIAESKLRQDGQWFAPGDTFMTSDEDAADLVAMGMARRATVVEKAVEAVTSRRGTYKRRDLQAEEEQK